MNEEHRLILDKTSQPEAVSSARHQDILKENNALMQLSYATHQLPDRAGLLARARQRAEAPAPISGWRAPRIALEAALLILLALAATLLLPRLSPTSRWTTQIFSFAAGEALASESAYTAVLEIASLPYGQESAEVKKLLMAAFEEMYRQGKLDNGLIYHFYNSSNAPPTINVLLYGVTEEQARELLAAMARAGNVANPRLADTLVFHQSKVKLPKSGGIELDQGSFLMIQDHFLCFPSGLPQAEAEALIEKWYVSEFGGEYDIQLTSDAHGGYRQHSGSWRPPGVEQEPMERPDPAFVDQVARQMALAQMPQYGASEPWGNEEIPVQPLEAGHRWVKGYRVWFNRLDSASTESRRALDADFEAYAAALERDYPGGMNLLREDDLLDGGPKVEEKWKQLTSALYVPVGDEAALDKLGLEVVSANEASGGDSMSRISASDKRVIFYDTAAGLGGGEVEITHGLQVRYHDSYIFVFPADFSEETIVAELEHWSDYWEAQVPDDLRAWIEQELSGLTESAGSEPIAGP